MNWMRPSRSPLTTPDFLAYHNGLTIICDSYWLRNGKLKIRNPSVVNGAQSVIAFDRKSKSLTQDLRVFVKLVEVKGRPSLAREVSRRSNTQNPVNPRMLMSNSGPQLRLSQEFSKSFPGIEYVTKPDQAIKPSGRYINNDEAAQLLTAVFLEKPWLAVKRASLFNSDNHPAVFQRGHTAAHVVLADEIGLAVDRVRNATPPVIPEHYLSIWKLTRMVLVYLTGQVLRAGEEVGDHHLISDPPSGFEVAAPRALTADARKRIADAAGLAAISVKQRFGALGEGDDYRKNFKNEAQLLGIGSEARTLYSIRKDLPAAPTSAGT